MRGRLVAVRSPEAVLFHGFFDWMWLLHLPVVFFAFPLVLCFSQAPTSLRPRRIFPLFAGISAFVSGLYETCQFTVRKNTAGSAIVPLTPLM